MLVATINTIMVRRQRTRLKKLDKMTSIGMEEIHKHIREKDEVVTHLYQLYTIVNELHQIISSILSPSYYSDMPVADNTIRSAVFYSQTGTGEAMRTCKMFHMTYSLHNDVNVYVYVLAQLFRWIELKNRNQTAIHALHTGALHTTIERTSQLLHSTMFHHLRVPLIIQHSVGEQMGTVTNESTQQQHQSRAFLDKLRSWKSIVPRLSHHPGVKDPVLQTAHPFVNYSVAAASDDKVALNASYVFGGPFSRLIENTHTMLRNIECEKTTFLQMKYGKYQMVDSVLNSILYPKSRSCYERCCNKKALKRVVDSVYTTANQLNKDVDPSNVLSAKVMAAFKVMCRTKHSGTLRVLAQDFVGAKSTDSLQPRILYDRIVSAFYPVLFRCTLAENGFGDIGYFADVIGDLLTQTDTVILNDNVYRQKLASHLQTH